MNFTIGDVERWDAERESTVRSLLQRDRTSLDSVLYKLHFNRNRTERSFRHGAREFCLLAYDVSNDVRYFNEFLWFCGGASLRKREAFEIFERNLSPDGWHSLPVPVAPPVRTAGVLCETEHATQLRVGVFGYPHRFRGLAAKLNARNHSVHAVCIPYGARSWRRWAMETPIVRRLVASALGWARPCLWPDRPPGDSELGSIVASLSLDVAVHRLGFIIKENLIRSTRLGIINDHLGLLPTIRGRSSVEFSLLHGVPVGATTHFVDTGVDTGPIIRQWIYPLAEISSDTIDGVKAAIRSGSDDRFADAVDRISRGGPTLIENAPSAGIRYFSIAPELTAYVAKMLPAWKQLAPESSYDLPAP